MPPTTSPLAPETRKGAFTADLAFALYRELRGTPGSLSFSPFSIASALVAAQAGAAGSTRSAIEDVLHRKGAGESLIAQAGALTRELQDLAHHQRQPLHLSLAHALWTQTGYALRPAYVESLQKELGADAREVDFGAAPTEAAREINAWVAEKTADKITSILPEQGLDPLTRCVLANAVYLKAPWSRPFAEWYTRPRPFHLSDGTRVEVPAMFQEEGFGYLREGGLEVVQLHYRNWRVAMLVLLPDPGQLERVERELDTTRLTGLVAALERREIKLFLPRFRIQSSLPLRPPLERLGMKAAFGPDADFAGVSSEPGFRLDEIAHKTFVNVDEFGTEAAAATAVMTLGGIPHGEREVHVDRPFLFLIRDADTGTVLFMGRVLDPRG